MGFFDWMKDIASLLNETARVLLEKGLIVELAIGPQDAKSAPLDGGGKVVIPAIEVRVSKRFINSFTS